MTNMTSALRTQFSHIMTKRIWWVVGILVFLIQPLLAFISAKQLIQIGLDATPETHPQLAQALPPVDYLGFEVTGFGIMAMVALGAVLGAEEYKNHQLRTSFLCNNKRKLFFFSKGLVMLFTLAVVSFISIFLTVMFTHIALADLGLSPFKLSKTAWIFIGYVIVVWLLLTLLAFYLGMIFRNSILPLIFLAPQFYIVGIYLMKHYSWGIYLPVAAGQLLTASPTDTLVHDPVKGSMILILWTLASFLCAMYFFTRRDVGGVY